MNDNLVLKGFITWVKIADRSSRNLCVEFYFSSVLLIWKINIVDQVFMQPNNDLKERTTQENIKIGKYLRPYLDDRYLKGEWEWNFETLTFLYLEFLAHQYKKDQYKKEAFDFKIFSK